MERCVEIDHYHKKEKKKRAIPIYWLGMGIVYVKDGIFSTFTILWYFFFLICPSAGNLLKYVLCIIIFDQYAFFFKNVYLVSRNCECVHAQFLQSCLTFCNPMDCSPPGSSVHGISRRESWRVLPFPSIGDLPHSGIKPLSLASPALVGGYFYH